MDEEDIHDKFSDELLQGIVTEIKKNKEETELYHKYIEAYKKAIRIKETKLTEFFDKNPEIYDILKVHNF